VSTNVTLDLSEVDARRQGALILRGYAVEVDAAGPEAIRYSVRRAGAS
jgi:hypothetical protein